MNLRPNMLLTVLAAGAGLGCGEEPAEVAAGFVHVQGDRLVDASGAPLALEGIAFADGEEPTAYAEVAKMGLNYVRLYFRAPTLEDDAGSYDREALARLDDNVASARNNGLYLVLAMEVPPGGSPLDCGNDPFWDSPEHRDRFVEIWRMLAMRYASERTIAGYSVLGSPNPNHAIEQWADLAERVTSAIREVDREHVINIERALSVGCEFGEVTSKTFVRVSDANVVYEFSRLQPWSYVAQLTVQGDDSEFLPAYGPYPDETRSGDPPVWLYTPKDTRPSAAQLSLKPEETDWTQKTFYYTVTEPRFRYAVPALQADYTSGKAYFDAILIEEITDTGEAIVVKDIDVESPDDWHPWQGIGGVEIPATGVATTAPTAHRGRASVAMSSPDSEANLGGLSWSQFPVSVGRTYRVTSWVKGENIDASDSARVRLDFWGDADTRGFNRETLEALFTDFRAWGRVQGVPMAVSLFGAARPSFTNDLGGLAWANDMIDIMREEQLSWAYLAYRDANFGIYTNPTGAPDPETINQPLVELFTQKRE